MDEYEGFPPEPKNTLWFRLTGSLRTFKARIVFSIGKRLPPRETRLEDYYGSVVHVCPRCGDFVYCAEQCVSCGQRFLPGAKTIGGMLDERFTDP